MKQPPHHDDGSDTESVTLTDETGRAIACSIEYEFEVEGEDYVLLVPIDTPVDILALSDDDKEDEVALATDEEIDVIFDTARAVLAEYDLKLQRTALTLTVAGEIPGLDDEELDDEELDDDDREQFLWIASFYHEEQEYAVCTPLDPFFVLARLNQHGEPELLSDEEYRKLEPMMPSIESILEEQLFADLD
mgnify:CR=1